MVARSIFPMTHIHLYTSNRLEMLAEKLAEVLRVPLASPLTPEIVVVQSKGMERWLAMQLAQRFGICANVKFPFPNAFVHEMLSKIIPNIPDPTPFDPQLLIWKIMKLLPDFIDRPEFLSIKNYLGGSQFDLKAFQLAERIADRFDQYLLYRPDWIFRWERGEDHHWQAMLWRRLVQENGPLHRATLGKQFLEQVQSLTAPPKSFPERVSVFGISALPPFHLHILKAISKFTPVHLFVMNPCREFWFDIPSLGGDERYSINHPDRTGEAEDFDLESGNSLLASMGALGREFLGMIYDFDFQEHAEFIEPGEKTLLSHIQSDILNLKQRGIDQPKVQLAANDDSIQIHSCHSPMREVEVLQDQLLRMFEQDAELLPKDILVMTPEIESYAPYIHAVFDLPMDDPRRIPFSISDRTVRQESELINTFLSLLDLSHSRCTSNEVMTVLESPAVQRRFNLSETELDRIRHWISETHIRWGIDAEHRQELGLPNTLEHTWRAGLDRLLLGYALPGQGKRMFANILPYDAIEGDDAELLGNFLDFLEQLFLTIKSLHHPRSLKEWSEQLQRILENLFAPDPETENDYLLIWRSATELGKLQQQTDFRYPIHVEVIKNYLKGQFERTSYGFGFMTGGVTFCAMLPMRSIPFKIICLLGMNDDVYPRQEQKLGFDLMAHQPRPGDRSRRKDDRYLFLEAILSARKKLYISFVGQSLQDNSPIPPSVLVNELLDYIDANYEIPEKNISDHLITKHRLQAFSPAYFQNDQKLFSFSAQHFQTAKKMLEPRSAPSPFITQGLSIPDESWRIINLIDLVRFFENPAKFFVTRRLGMILEEVSPIFEEDEPFQLEKLDQYHWAQQLLTEFLAGKDLSDSFELLRAQGALPHGSVGQIEFDRLRRTVHAFAHKLQPYLFTGPLPALTVDLNLGQFKLVGKIEGVFPERLLTYRLAKIRARDRLRAWIYHLVLNLVQPKDYPRISWLIGWEAENGTENWEAWQFNQIENSHQLLADLLDIYWQGLSKPIHFFPETSWEFATRLIEKNKPEPAALKSARRKWRSDDMSRGWFESQDPYYQLCFEKFEPDPLDVDFQNLAIDIFRPVIEYQTELKDR
ncbi:MAG: exodeoxyribonuclease V subunit gamma [candidate division KSB1 bacterium]|nr:exodeoxyribonuclease V subunit gamma [candidate division KSB1 bacterium]